MVSRAETINLRLEAIVASITTEPKRGAIGAKAEPALTAIPELLGLVGDTLYDVASIAVSLNRVANTLENFKIEKIGEILLAGSDTLGETTETGRKLMADGVSSRLEAELVAFGAWLTTANTVLTVSANHDAAPMVEAIQAYLAEKGPKPAARAHSGHRPEDTTVDY